MPKGSKLNEKELKEFRTMSLERSNKQIESCLYYSKEGGTTSGKKAFFKKLIQQEKIREEYNIEAPYRDFLGVIKMMELFLSTRQALKTFL